MSKTWIAALFGGACGFLVTVALRDGGPQAALLRSGVAGPVDHVTPDGVGDADAPREPSALVRTEADGELVSAALRGHFGRRFQEAWSRERGVAPSEAELEAGARRFRESVLALPDSLAAEGAREANRRDAVPAALDAGDGLALLALADEGWYQPDETDLAWDDLDRCVERRRRAGAVDGPTFAGDADLGLDQGVTLVYGPGTFELDEARLRGPDRRTLPSDVAIEGAGMDATLLRLGDISIQGPVERLSFKNLTLDAAEDGLFDLRTGGAVIDLERVRVVRFDAGHGGCQIFSVREGTLLRARDCEFVGGYGRSPGRGELYRGPILARFDDCRFELLEMELAPGRADRLLFRRCTFALFEEDPRTLANQRTSFVDCRFERPLERDTPRTSLQRALGELFDVAKPR